jgi:hypothetical protein
VTTLYLRAVEIAPQVGLLREQLGGGEQ